MLLQVRVSPGSRWAAVSRPIVFLLAWAALDCLFNLRYPSSEPALWYLLPSIDAAVLLVGLLLARRMGVSLPRGVRAAITALIVIARIFRVADGAVERHFHRALSLYLDVPLVPNLIALMRSTVPGRWLVVGAFLILLALAALAAFAWWIVGVADRSLAAVGSQRLLAGVLIAGALLSPLWPQRRNPHLHYGLFGKSIVARLAPEVWFLRHARDYRREKADAVARVQQELRAVPSTLDRLHRADLLLFIVESYGATVFENPAYAREMAPAYDAFERDLRAHGYTMASSLLASPTYGGRSWLAHGTLAAGVRIDDGLAYAVLLEAQPPPLTMAEIFRRAGYRTVLVQPNTTQRWPEGEVVGFEQKYYLMDLDYQGPSYQWATMPDQYVVDFIHRREVARPPTAPRAPLFVEYALVSSHAPWSTQPRFVADWDRLGDGGGLFNQQAPVRFPVTWSSLDRGGEAYLTSLRYDFDVLRSYIADRITGDAVIILLGDHQPSAEITGGSPSHGVPIHIISRDPALIQRVVAAGYTSGLRVDPAMAALPMERFLPWLVERFSGAATSDGKPARGGGVSPPPGVLRPRAPHVTQ